MRSPIIWFGGKGLLVHKIMPFIEHCPHHTYVEPFGGGASLLFAKRPSPVEVYNDIDEGLANFFRVLADPELFPQFERRVQATPYSRAIYNECRDSWREQTDPVLRACQWFVVARQSFSGRFESGWSSAVTFSCGGMVSTCFKWRRSIERLAQVHARLMQVQIEQADWRTILDRYDTPETLFYCDPPYVASTRRSGKYAHELIDVDHGELVKMLLSAKGAVLLSAYESEIYAPLVDSGWSLIRWDVPCYAAGNTRATGLQGDGAREANQRRAECLYVSPRSCDAGLFADSEPATRMFAER